MSPEREDMRKDPEVKGLLVGLTLLIEALKHIEDDQPPEVFERWCHQVTVDHKIPCEWRRIRKLYADIEKYGLKIPIIVGRRRNPPRLRIVSGNRRTAVLFGLDRPIPVSWEETETDG